MLGCTFLGFFCIHALLIMCDFEKCRAKTSSLLQFTCKNCARSFCVKHRTPEDHLCTCTSVSKEAERDSKPLFSKKEKLGLII